MNARLPLALGDLVRGECVAVSLTCGTKTRPTHYGYTRDCCGSSGGYG